MKDNPTPIRRQYLKIKQQYPDAILFFRLGDFYETFDEDARITSHELEIVLTSRSMGKDYKVPMAGIPYHAVDDYLAKLIRRGYKVAICEQMEDPKLVKGLVKRDVVRIITPGTVIEGSMLDDAVNNYLCAICKLENETGLCFADVSTSQFYLTAIKDNSQDEIINQLSTYQPREIIVNTGALDFAAVAKYTKVRLNAELQLLNDEKFEFKAATDLIVETLSREEIDKLSLGNSKSVVGALGAVIDYLCTVQKKERLEAPSEIDFFDSGEYMKLDMSARRNLELTQSMMTGNKKHSLLWVIDKTKTAPGKRMIRAWLERPLMSVSQISKRQNSVGELADNPELRDNIRRGLTGVSDIERLLARIAYSTANAKELKSLEATILKLPEIKAQLSGCSAAMLRDIYSSIDLLSDVSQLIGAAIVDEPPFSLREGGMIRQGYNAEIDELRSVMEDGADIIASIEAKQKEKTGIPKLKIGYNRVFGYYIEVTNSYKDMVPETYIRKQTLTNCERYITQELKDLEGKILGAKDRVIALEYEVFCAVRDTIAAEASRIQKTAKALAVLDVLASLAEVAVNNNYTCPQLNTNGVIDIKEGRHAVVEALLDDSLFVPNDTLLDMGENRCSIITGPNMAGKSTYMRQIA